MVARLVRDQKVVGSSPVTSTTKKASDIPRLLFLYSKVIRDLRGGKAKFFRRRSEGSTSDKTADTRCFPCASAQGASPVTSTTKKASDINYRLPFFVTRFQDKIMDDKITIKRLLKKQWQGYILPIGYTTDSYYDVELSSSKDNFTVKIQKRDIDTPITHTPEENDYPDKLFAPHFPGARAYGAFLGEKLIGAIEIYAEEWNNSLRVTELWVDENFRKRGLGRSLMNIAKDYAKKHNFRMVILETQSCNTNAIGFYLHEGFTLAGVLPFNYTNTDIQRKEVRFELGWFNNVKN